VDAIAAAAARNRRIAVEAFMALHHPQTLAALEIAASGALGTLQLISATFSFFLTTEDDPRIDPAMGGGSLWDVGCYPVSIARRIAGREPNAVAAFARLDDLGVDRTFVGQLRFPGDLFAQFDSGFSSPHRERVEIVGTDASLVLGHPFLPEPDGPPPVVTIWRDEVATAVEVASVDQYRAEVDDLTAAILDGGHPRVDLAFSRGTIATLVELHRVARLEGPESARP
jgi:predicted dehydrogenase